MELQDNEIAAMLAAETQGFLTSRTKGVSDSRQLNRPESRVDWRRFLGPPQQHPQQGYPPQHQQYPPNYGAPPYNPYAPPPQYPPQQFQEPGYNTEFGQIPGSVPLNGNPGQIPLPVDEKGQPIIPAGYEQQFQRPAIPQGFSMDGAKGFEMPNYNNSSNSVSDEKLDDMMKEIKLLKRAVNTLTNLIKKSILSKEDQPTTPEIINESNS